MPVLSEHSFRIFARQSIIIAGNSVRGWPTPSKVADSSSACESTWCTWLYSTYIHIYRRTGGSRRRWGVIRCTHTAHFIFTLPSRKITDWPPDGMANGERRMGLDSSSRWLPDDYVIPECPCPNMPLMPPYFCGAQWMLVNICKEKAIMHLHPKCRIIKSE